MDPELWEIIVNYRVQMFSSLFLLMVKNCSLKAGKVTSESCMRKTKSVTNFWSGYTIRWLVFVERMCSYVHNTPLVSCSKISFTFCTYGLSWWNFVVGRCVAGESRLVLRWWWLWWWYGNDIAPVDGLGIGTESLLCKCVESPGEIDICMYAS